MPRILVSLNEIDYQKIQEISDAEGISMSKSAADLIKLGLKIKDMKQDESGKKEAELERKHTEYLLRILSVVSDLYRCHYDAEKMAYKADTAGEALGKIKEKMLSYIDGYTGRDSE